MECGHIYLICTCVRSRSVCVCVCVCVCVVSLRVVKCGVPTGERKKHLKIEKASRRKKWRVDGCRCCRTDRDDGAIHFLFFSEVVVRLFVPTPLLRRLYRHAALLIQFNIVHINIEEVADTLRVLLLKYRRNDGALEI